MTFVFEKSSQGKVGQYQTYFGFRNAVFADHFRHESYLIMDFFTAGLDHCGLS